MVVELAMASGKPLPDFPLGTLSREHAKFAMHV